MVVLCVVVLPPETRLKSQVLETRLSWLCHSNRLDFPPLLFVSPMVVVVCLLLCVCAVITKKHKVESPAKNP